MNIGEISINLSKKYNKNKEDVLLELIKEEQKVHSRVISKGNVPYRFDRCYFYLASGYLSSKYKNLKRY